METNTVILELKAIDSGKIQPDEVGQAPEPGPGVGIYLPYRFSIPVGLDTRYISAQVQTPTGFKEDLETAFTTPGHVALEYQPKESGKHILTVFDRDTQVRGSPYQFDVHQVNSKYTHAFGAGLSYGVVNNPAEFTVVTQTAGARGLCLAIEGPSKADIHCYDNEDGSVSVTYVPTKPGTYNIVIKQGNQYICGSPFTAHIRDGESYADAMNAGGGNFASGIRTDYDISDLFAAVQSPSGFQQPCTLKKQPDGHLGFCFFPYEVGTHLVTVVKDGKPIEGSPFKVHIDESELATGHSNKVKVSGDGIKEGVTNHDNEFILDTRDAGYGELDLFMEGPRKSKVAMECIDNDDGTCRVVYRPTKPGKFLIHIKFGGEHIEGSPFEIEVEDPIEPPPERNFRTASKQGIDLWY